jgi:phosphatidylglycerophosphate synthase
LTREKDGFTAYQHPKVMKSRESELDSTMRLLADLLTASRIIAAPIIIWLIVSDERVIAYYLFAAAAITDLLDGYFARRSKKVVTYGANFDGLADFFLSFPTIFALGAMGEAPWLVAAGGTFLLFILVVLPLISRSKGRLTIPHLETSLLAAFVYSSIMAHIIRWQYAEELLLVGYIVVLYYATKYLAYMRAARKSPEPG